MKLKHLLILSGLAAALAACGDNPSDTVVAPPASTEVPASATASTRAYATYTGSLAPSETGSPLDVSKVTPPTSESEDPLAI